MASSTPINDASQDVSDSINESLTAPFFPKEVVGRINRIRNLSTICDVRLFPSSIKFLIWNELCERFSFYGMKAILALFLLEHLGLTENQSTEVVHLFIVACYATPLIGAFMSDGFLGKYKTILYLSLVYSVGNWVMCLAAVIRPHEAFVISLCGTLLALVLVALGTGGIKPCIAAFGGDQIEECTSNGHVKDKLRGSFFSLYYFTINAGSLTSTLCTPILRSSLSYSVAFAVPAFLMMCAIIIFFLGRRAYVHKPPEKNVFVTVIKVIVDAIKLRNVESREDLNLAPLDVSRKSPCKSGSWLDVAKLRHNAEDVEDVKSLIQVLIILLPAPLFWSLFDQKASKWVFQSRDMDNGVRFLGDINILPDQMQVLNPFLILVMIPFFDQILYPCFQKRGFPLMPITRMLIGMLLCSLSFLISGLLQLAIESRAVEKNGFASTSSFMFLSPKFLSGLTGTKTKKIHILWQIPQYIVITLGEILFSITGISFAYSQAPASMKSVIQSIWLLTEAAGNLFTVITVAIIGDRLSKANEFFIFSGMCTCAMLLMMWIGSTFIYRHELTSDTAETREEADAMVFSDLG